MALLDGFEYAILARSELKKAHSSKLTAHINDKEKFKK